MDNRIILPLAHVGLADIALVGGKCASLGEMIQHLSGSGVHIPGGFVVTTDAYHQFLEQSQLEAFIRKELDRIDFDNVESLRRAGSAIRQAISNARFPNELSHQIIASYEALSQSYGQAAIDVAVRSSATAEDLPDASFAGQQETYLNVRGPAALIDAVRNCFASLFTDRAISYRQTFNFDIFNVGLSVCVQKMVRSDLAASGVAFSLDTETGFRDLVVINGSYGLGELVVHFEPEEENPMIGWRGASRYYSAVYKPAFRLECRAVKKVREVMGLGNVAVMIPFCRTVDELIKVQSVMSEAGLTRGENNLEVYLMAEIPSNILLAEQFAKHIDGFSIGSNDLTQLTLGLDRDSALVAHLYDERNEAVKALLRSLIRTAKKCGVRVGICGQGPSDFPEFAQFLVAEGIDSISVTPDSLIKTIRAIHAVEQKSTAEIV